MRSSSPRSSPPARRRRLLAAAVAAGTAAVGVAAVHARQGGAVAGPDVVAFSLDGADAWGVEDGFAGYSLGMTACNRGDQPLEWCDQSFGCGVGATPSHHPVMAQNMYRLKDGRFEQIGMSWLKHGFSSANEPGGSCVGVEGQACEEPPAGENQLGIGCIDPYSAFINGRRPLGRRSEVVATTGAYPFPPSSPAGPYTAYQQRLKVAAVDLDPALNPGALYFLEGHYVAPDDAAAGNGLNNATYRRVTVGPAPAHVLTLTGNVFEQQPAIFAWRAQDPAVDLRAIDVPGSTPRERFHVARKVTDLGGGNWHYEFAVHNLNSNRSAHRFTVGFPAAATIGGAGFRDVDHHSGEPYATTDWAIDLATPGEVTWATDAYGTDPDANALRWGTAFSFWFDATAGPEGTSHTLGLFEPGTPGEVTFALGTGVFTDGFESGDTTAWTSSTP